MSSDPSPGGTVSRAGSAGLVLAAAAYVPLRLWANNLRYVVDGTWIVLGVALTAAVGLLLLSILIRSGVDRRGAAIGVATLLLLATGGSAYAERFGTMSAIAIAVALSAVVTIIVGRLRDRPAIRIVFEWLRIAIPAIVAATWLLAALGADWSSSIGAGAAEDRSPRPAAHPDIVWVVVDGYGSVDELRRTFGFDNADLTTFLEANGFEVLGDAKTAYSITALSVSSMLQGDLQLVSDSFTYGDRRRLYDVMSGENRLVDEARANGFRYVHIANGWQGTRCGPSVDRCLPARFDETLGSMFDASIFSSWWKRSHGHVFTAGSLDASRNLLEVVEGLDDAEPELVFAHLVIPHAPLFLDSSCEFRFDPRLDGASLALRQTLEDTVLLEQRKAGYLQQVQCANSIIRGIVDELSPETWVVVVGDHGPDSRAQQDTPAEEWSAEAIDERMSAFMAVRLPDSCEDDVTGYTVDLGRAVIGCLAGRSIGTITPRYFVASDDDAASSRLREVEVGSEVSGA